MLFIILFVDELFKRNPEYDSYRGPRFFSFRLPNFWVSLFQIVTDQVYRSHVTLIPDLERHVEKRYRLTRD